MWYLRLIISLGVGEIGLLQIQGQHGVQSKTLLQPSPLSHPQNTRETQAAREALETFKTWSYYTNSRSSDLRTRKLTRNKRTTIDAGRISTAGNTAPLRSCSILNKKLSAHATICEVREAQSP